MNKSILTLILIMVVLLWVYISYLNYSNTIEVIKLYKETIDSLSESEEKEEDTFRKAFIFNEREDLINENLVTEQMRIDLEKNTKTYKVKLFFSFLILGPFYNLK